jgi:hypothetical protein
LPWLKIGTEGRKATALETVYGRTVRGRSVVFRLYDKGRETDPAPAGTWLRLERQRRYRKDRERTVTALLEDSLRATFVGRELAAIADSDETVTVCDELEAVRLIKARMWDGRLTPRMAEMLAGYVMLSGSGLPKRTSERRRARLRLEGIAVDPLAGGRSSVPVSDYLREFVHAWAA